ncbi:Acetaldehyde dehydrogenase @ Acetaldehyde dehydrogenase, ethanolamine utilization cluster [hydrothermal vent metagenome]|uniref:Acetaldehyde dehydrogenase @ Acetaldehyde dehydrogenase, ethanolamine utilization cluster n=1 Tax=hydrothermal vent metagenome TaxID=652676 RepID=A0A3B1DE48_9ZZZZ
MIQANEQTIRAVVERVVSQIQNGKPSTNGSLSSFSSSNNNWGVYQTVDEAVAAANVAFENLKKASVEQRTIAVKIVRDICFNQREELGRLELEETKIGRLDHKIEKLTAMQGIPGVEWLTTNAVSGDRGLTITEFAPFGVIGAITPVTHSLPTLACNFINMVSAGNTMVVNPHPSGKKIACEGVRRFNKAIFEATGLRDLVTIIEEPTLETAEGIFHHRGVKLLCVTGGPGVARAALASRKRAIVAGPGNPPVVVDETADLDNAAKSIVAGAAYDNNLLCIGEKEVFAVDSIFDDLMSAVSRNWGYRLDAQQVKQLTERIFSAPTEPSGHPKMDAAFIGKDPAVLAEAIGLKIPSGVQILFGETETSNPFVPEEQMMPFVPFVRAKCVNHAIQLAQEFEHGFGHTAIMHSRNTANITKMCRIMDTTLFINNGPCMAGLGNGGEGYGSFSIATPTGEGVTTPMTFTRQRRCSMVDDLRIF